MKKMIKSKKKYAVIILIVSIVTVSIFNACSPIREFSNAPVYEGENSFNYFKPDYNKTKKTVVIVADNKGSEIFDLMAPFYLFNKTGKANVYIVAQDKYPVTAMKGIYLLPHFSFTEFDSLNITADAIVIPNLSAMKAEEQDPQIIKWIKENYTEENKILAICDGSLTAAETGLYDGKPITTHASDLEIMEEQNNNPVWVKNMSVTKSGNLYSTGGISNAVEGSLVVIDTLFGEEVMQKVMKDINYPYSQPKIEHHSEALNFRHKLSILNKVLFTDDKKIGILLQDGINELELAAVIDTYNRVFPEKLQTYVLNGKKITSKNGLTILPTGNSENAELDELHILRSPGDLKEKADVFGKPEIVMYHQREEKYIFDHNLRRINSVYCEKYGNIVKLLLDYN